MNDNRIFKSKKAEMLKLLKLKMPALVIHKMLGVSQETVYNYLIKLRKSGEWTKEIAIIDKARPHILKLYASSKYAAPGRRDNRFESVLAEVLEEKKILEALSYALPAILSFSKVKFVDDVPAGYRKLIEQLIPVYQDSSCVESTVWKRYLRKIADSEAPLPESKQFLWRDKHFVHDIIRSYAQEVRGYVAPILTVGACKIIDEKLEKMPYPRKDVIDLYFGLHADGQTLETIGDSIGLSRERIRQIKEKSIQKLKRMVKDDLYHVSNAWEELHSTKENNQKQIQGMEENYKKSIFQLNETYEKKFMELAHPEAKLMAKRLAFLLEENETLLKRIDEVDFSVRSYNCLRDSNIEYIWEVVGFTKEQIIKFRNLGKKSLYEIEDFLMNHDLQFGMEFTESQLIYLKSKTTEKNRK